MKKMISFLFIIIAAFGCNKEKIYKENLEGTWQVYKYLERNVDKTAKFQSQHGIDYSITFTRDDKFSEFMAVPDTNIINGTYSFTDNDEKIVLTHIYNTFTTDTLWVDSVTYAWDTTFYPHTVDRKYTLFNLTKDHVQLRNDTSQLYMNKKQ